MKKLIAVFSIILTLSSNNINANTNLNKIFGGVKDNIDEKPEQIVDQKYSKISVGPLGINGYFHFFWSNTPQEEIYNITDSNGKTEAEGAINFLYQNELDDENKFSSNFNIKKKFSNKIRFRTTAKLENKTYGSIELSSYSKIQDNLLVNTYWIKSGSDGAWDRSINTSLSIFNDTRENLALNNILTSYDTAETFGGDVDSANLAYYIKPIDGLTIGAAFSPRTYHTNIENDFFNYKNIIKVGALYDHNINEDTNIKLSFLGEHGTPAKNPYNTSFEFSDLSDLNALNFGAIIKYQSISLGGSVGLWGKSGLLHNIPTNINLTGFTKPKHTHYFDIAAAYNINEKANVSLSYFKSVYGQNYAQDSATSTTSRPSTNGNSGHSEFHNVSLALDYKLFNDLVVPYAEINKFIVKDNNSIIHDEKRHDNNGWVLVFGTKSKF
jgi:hypothetical protein